ncbi:AbiH family protein [Latilactobacillus sp. 5-91]|uniref:AbiH family protein n=1 Tax=Latilactobacillus sp. 5-91 TaxID=3410924 RepID=UPI003C71E96A
MNLFILGNGFDLMCGASTKIDDYLRYKDQQIKGLGINLYSLITNLPIITKSKSKYKVNYYFTPDERLNDETTLDFWTVLFLKNYYEIRDTNNEKQNNKLTKWVDIESLIFEVASGIHNMFNIPPSERMLTTSDVEFIKTLLLKNGYPTYPNSNGILPELEETMEFLFKELIQFDLNFANYLSYLETNKSADFSIQKEVYAKKKAFWEVNKKNKLLKLYQSDIILNFNYTDSQRPITFTSDGMLANPVNEINIHGRYPDAKDSINNFNGNAVPLIFGFDQSLLDSFDSYQLNRFTKTNQLLELNRRYPAASRTGLFNPNIQDIYFMGHSLSKADWSYFYSIFDFLKVYENENLKLHFLYSIEYATDPNNSSFLGQYQSSVFSLINNYGAKLNNINNGDYLLTKLTLENRIDFIPVAFTINN